MRLSSSMVFAIFLMGIVSCKHAGDQPQSSSLKDVQSEYPEPGLKVLKAQNDTDIEFVKLEIWARDSSRFKSKAPEGHVYANFILRTKTRWSFFPDSYEYEAFVIPNNKENRHARDTILNANPKAAILELTIDTEKTWEQEYKVSYDGGKSWSPERNVFYFLKSFKYRDAKGVKTFEIKK